MSAFRFTTAQWDAIGAHLDRIGRGRSAGDRQSLELQCEIFVRLRPKLGRGLPTPSRARDAWIAVNVAAKRLRTAIAELKDAGGADLTLIETSPGASIEWLAGLDGLIRGADQAAGLEMVNPPKVAKNTDPLRDDLIVRLAWLWKGYGGGLSNAEDGALVTFLVTVTGPAFEAIGEPPPSTSTIRGVLRKASLD